MAKAGTIKRYRGAILERAWAGHVNVARESDNGFVGGYPSWAAAKRAIDRMLAVNEPEVTQVGPSHKELEREKATNRRALRKLWASPLTGRNPGSTLAAIERRQNRDNELVRLLDETHKGHPVPVIDAELQADADAYAALISPEPPIDDALRERLAELEKRNLSVPSVWSHEANRIRLALHDRAKTA
jgi:hypothetical protein